jgi:hypothetical protein
MHRMLSGVCTNPPSKITHRLRRYSRRVWFPAGVGFWLPCDVVDNSPGKG